MDDEGAGRASAYLRYLLQERPDYARLWQARARRATGLNQSAVAATLAEHLWETGQADDRDVAVPRRLKDVVSRALAGRYLSARTLTLFIDAFGITPEDAATLWALRLGSSLGETLPVVQGHAQPPREMPPPRHQTLSLHEVHFLGPDGLPAEHRTTQVLRAMEEMDRYPYRFDTDVAVVQVLRGGRAGPLRRSEIPGLFVVEIELSRRLSPGETAALEFRTVFAFRSPPPPLFRRAAYQRVDNVELAVQFHPARLPVSVQWCQWDRHDDDEPRVAEDVQLDADRGVHRYLPRLEKAVVGFRWTFPS